MTDPADFDVVAIGGGIAGLVAADRAAELGLRAAVLEKGSGERYLCNSRYTIGVFHVAFHDVTSEAGTLSEAIRTATRGYAPTPLAEAVARDAGRLVRWLQEQGVRFVKAGPYEWMSWVLAPPVPRLPGLHWEGRAGDVLLRALGADLARRGGRLFLNTRAQSLLVKDGRCVGVEAVSTGGPLRFHAPAVLIADGGYQGDPDMVREHLSAQPQKLLQRGAGTGAGDGIRMAQAVGAKLVGMDMFYGHVQSREALENHALWPYPILDLVAGSGIVVDSRGNRFADEGLGGVYLANAIARLDDPLSSAVVFDDAIWTGPGSDYILPPNPNLVDAGGRMLRASDLDSLAGRVGLPAASLSLTVNTYNDAVRSGTLDDLTPPRSSHIYKPFPVHRPPYYAIPLCAGITYTMGGVATDEDGRVLNLNDAPIDGLFAAGSTTGGLEGGPVAGYIGGLIKAGVFALRAAECIAKTTHRA